MKTVNWIIAFSLANTAFAAEVFFTPGQDCENQIVNAIAAAKTEVAVAVYSINNKRIVSALIDAHKKGIKVRVLTDAVHAAGKSSKVITMLNSGLTLRVHSKHKIMHNKFAVVDKKWAITGSYNWTEPASKYNSENCVTFSENDIIQAYAQQFENLWSTNAEDKSRLKLAKIAEKCKNRLPSSVKR